MIRIVDRQCEKRFDQLGYLLGMKMQRTFSCVCDCEKQVQDQNKNNLATSQFGKNV